MTVSSTWPFEAGEESLEASESRTEMLAAAGDEEVLGVAAAGSSVVDTAFERVVGGLGAFLLDCFELDFALDLVFRAGIYAS